MAVTKKAGCAVPAHDKFLAYEAQPTLLPLKALTAAAISLPGLMLPNAQAADGDGVDFQYSHYQEGKRNISLMPHGAATATGSKSWNPIEVDSLHGSARVSLSDRVKFAFNYLQDTWGGATPVATTPYLASGNVPLTKDDVIVGASPIVINNAGLLNHYVNRRLKSKFPIVAGVGSGGGTIFQVNPATGLPIFKQDQRLTHVMSSASPETRKQGDFKLTYDWTDDIALSAGGGISIENDYDSRFGNVGARFDFNQKQTTLNVDLSYTNSFTYAILDHDDYTLKSLLPSHQYIEEDALTTLGRKIIHGTRQDWATHLGLTQVLNKDAVLSADFSYTRSTGYQSNPYKGVAVAFADFSARTDANGNPLPDSVFPAQLAVFTEQRPEVRNQFGVGGRYVQFVEPLDAALHLDYRFSADDWGIHSHTFEADWVQPLGQGWTVTPRIRYYSQDAADFYAPYFLTQQSPSVITNKNIDAKKFPTHYSSDHRLSGFGALSGGVTVVKQFAKGIALETGFEYYTHQGGLKIGGGGEGAYADFDYWLANAALKVDLNALSLNFGGSGHASHHGHHAHGGHAPAGVLFDHALPKAGDFMVGYRYQWSSQNGKLRNGTRNVSDSEFIANACPDGPCYLAPDSMNMSMHMLDLMYAPTDWLTLMLMPQWADMDMHMRKPEGAPSAPGSLGLHATHHAQNGHESGGFGDLGMYALFKVYDDDTHHVIVTPGFTAPVADVGLQLRRNHQLDGGFLHYCMMLGSGTWDFTPSLTYTGQAGDWSWGAQANGVLRMGSRNKSGYKLGDIFQATAWGGYNLNSWLTATLRGVYTTQGSIRGQFFGSDIGQFGRDEDGNGEIDTYSSILKFGSMDYPGNYGGRFADIGFGLSATIPSGDLAGNRFAVEWLQPVYNDMNGYQQNRDGTLSATWSINF